jgi:hypothetical protein
MKDAPAFDFYPERWLAGVAEMDNLDQLAYLRLLCHLWLRDGLPESVDVLSRLAGIQVSPDVLVKFPLCNDGKRRNARLEEIRAEQRARIATRRQGAMKTNMKRWNGRVANESLGDRSATVERVANESLGDRSATVERVANESLSDRSATIERVANESPPPTTHPKQQQQQQQPAGARGHCDLDEARAYAVSYSKGNSAGIAIPMHVVSQWHDAREAVGWVTVKGGLELPIADWKADLRIFATHYQKNELSRPNGAAAAKRAEREPPAAITAKDLPRL